MAKSKDKIDGRTRRDHGKEQRWREAIAEQQRGGESVRAFCLRHQLHETSFYYWRREIGLRDREVQDKSKARPGLAPVVLVDEPVRNSIEEDSASIEIVLDNGTVVRVPFGSTGEQLGIVLTALEQSRC